MTFKTVLHVVFGAIFLLGCTEIPKENIVAAPPPSDSPFIVILGTIQDAGSPHIACKKDCCKALFDQPDPNRQVVSLGLVDPVHSKSFLFDATPDISRQLKALTTYYHSKEKEIVDGIFLTHAHIGHYAGLMYLGMEATDAKKVAVYAMPRMKQFLETNGPWSQLVSRQNIILKELNDERSEKISEHLQVIPFTVPHRDEYSETVGYTIKSSNKSALFIPDIDKWEKWEKDIVQEIKKVDYAFLDATFFSGKELNNRDMKEIPHPFILESLEKFKSIPSSEKAKVYFIHFNHTNPVINIHSKEAKIINEKGFNIARIHQVFTL